MLKVALYLRKSREDERLEKELGKGETLSLHRRDLLKYAKAHNLHIDKIYEELVSGESLLYRPAMLELLKEVEQGMYDGVLCMDLQRLGRGDMEEQGIILKAFKKSLTKIITPDKTYDLENEFDEEYSEFEAFMSRKEYKMINKRLRRGVIRSVESGNYMAPYRPFGYEIANVKNGRTLTIKADEADIVKMIYDWYINEHVGSQLISGRLNSIGIKTTRGNAWSSHAIAELIKNPLYCGKIAYNRRFGYRTADKKKASKNRPVEEWLVVEGKHAAIISPEVYEKAISIMKTYRKSPFKPNSEVINPLAGIVICGVCGAKMVYRPYSKAGVLPHIICRQKCGNKSSKFIYIEKVILDGLENLLKGLKLKQDSSSESEYTDSKYDFRLKALERQLEETQRQKKNAYDLLEKEVYTVEVFAERLKTLDERTQSIKDSIEELHIRHADADSLKAAKNNIKTVESVLEAYTHASPSEKNLLLKTIVEKAVYLKEKNAREDDFTIKLYSRF